MSLNKSKDIRELKKFDIDLEFGQQWEKYIDDLFCGAKKAEIKTERDKWQKTGNICIEVESWGKPSGLETTEADVWVQNLVKDGKLLASIMIPTDVLKEILPDVSKVTVMGGDNNASKINLVPLGKLMTTMLSYSSD